VTEAELRNDAPDWAEAAEARLLDGAVAHAPRLGWSRRMMAQAAADAGLTRPEAELLLPEGPRDLAALLSRRHDRRALTELETLDVASIKIRERIRRGVLARCDAAMADEAAVRRWSGFLALPPNAPLAMRLVWESADGLWRWAGDEATDENHYTKRALLAEILVTTLAIRLSSGGNAAAAHLDGRIEAVMAFEKWKAGVRPSETVTRIARSLGRLRYGRA
jgi:ubiquinone biosynthesis protein COQ9